MKVAIIIERANVELGGAERSVFDLSSALRSAGMEVEILAAKSNRPAKHVTTVCDHIPGKRTPLAEYEKSLKEYLSENTFDIIHSFLPFDFADIYQPRGGSYPEAIIRNSASYHKPAVRLLKNITSGLNKHRKQLALAERSVCENPDGPIIAALSDYVAQQFKDHYCLCEDRIMVIRNGVLTDKQVSQKDIDHLRSRIMSELKLKEADQPTFFLCAANNFRLKGVRCLLQAMQMAASNSEYTAYLIVAGSGKQDKYKRLAKKLNIDRKVLFIGPTRKIEVALAVCHVAVLPTFYDPSSRFILEALIADKPVITTKYNGATELFANNRHGKIIDVPENISALSGAINYYTNPENIVRSASAIIKDNLIEMISVSRVARELKILYNSILAEWGDQ